jgi:hypothetical protein
MKKINHSNADDTVHVAILRPILEDSTLMALLKNRYVPASFIFKRVNRKPTPENCVEVVTALKALRTGGASSIGLYDMDVHFAMVSGVLHVGGGRLSGRRGKKVDGVEVGLAEVRESLLSASRVAGRVFATVHYDKLKVQYDLYEKVLRECESRTSLKDARARLSVSTEEWQKLKGCMGRFGLVRDVVCARPILLDGLLVKEIEQRFLGQRIEDVVPRLLREKIDTTRS